MGMIEVACFSCNRVHSLERVGFRQECDCGEDLHVCLNCKLHDPGSYNECKEPGADRVVTKDRSNLCDFFEAKSSLSDVEDKEAELLKAAEALFKK